MKRIIANIPNGEKNTNQNNKGMQESYFLYRIISTNNIANRIIKYNTTITICINFPPQKL